MLKDPVLLVHGIGNRDDLAHLRYWGRVPDHLRSLGCDVHISGQDAIGTIESNGQWLEEKIASIAHHTGAAGVHILAHSKGGLETRYALSQGTGGGYCRLGGRILSVTTLCTPHFGARAATWSTQFLPEWIFTVVGRVNDLFWKRYGDRRPDFAKAARQLSHRAMAQFNLRYPAGNQPISSIPIAKDGGNDPPFIWFASKLPDSGWGVLQVQEAILRRREGPNDAVVAYRAAQWGQSGVELLQRLGLYSDEVATTLTLPHYIIPDQVVPSRQTILPESIGRHQPLPLYSAWVAMMERLFPD